MDTNKVNYAEEKGGYYKVLGGLLLLTAITFIQPSMFLTDYTFGTQLFIGLIKAWMIVMYYMHMKGEKLIGATVMFALFLVIFFFIMVILDVKQFQFKDESHIVESSHTGVSSAPAHH